MKACCVGKGAVPSVNGLKSHICFSRTVLGSEASPVFKGCLCLLVWCLRKGFVTEEQSVWCP